jgi:hypothetical protein
MELSADAGLTISVFGAEPGSRSQESPSLLASWAATADQQPAPSSDDASRAGRRPA